VGQSATSSPPHIFRDTIEARDAETQELRTLLRTRKQVVRERSRHVQRIHKALEYANIKLEARCKARSSFLKFESIQAAPWITSTKTPSFTRGPIRSTTGTLRFQHAQLRGHEPILEFLHDLACVPGA